jgi:hypothetical protein
MLLDIRDQKIREQKIEKQGGEPVVVDLVPSIKERREACKLILAYCWGTPIAVGNDELQKRIFELEGLMKEGPWQRH